MTQNIFALVDCNNFYASCERVFKPALNNSPVAVLSNNDGCIVARSAEVKAMGIKMGTPYYQIKDKLARSSTKVFSSNYALYGDMSRRVMETLKEFSPKIEIYSIDEAFLDLTGQRTRNLNTIGQAMRSQVKQWTGIPTGVGIATTKTLAKLANHIAKKSPKANGVLNLVNTPYLDIALKRVSVDDVWGVGNSFSKTLHKRGIHTALDLSHANDRWIKSKRGVVGLRCVYELRGQQCYALEETPPPKKEISVSRSFGKYITTETELSEAMASYLSRAGEKLRKQNGKTSVIKVYVMTNAFDTTRPQYFNSQTVTLPVATNDTGELIQYGLQAMRDIYRDGFRFKKCGVILSQLVPQDQVQLNLFDTIDREKSGRLMTSFDNINYHLVNSSIHYGATGISKAWQTKFNMRSARYTTCWGELPTVQAN